MGVRREIMVLGLFAIICSVGFNSMQFAHANFDPPITIINPSSGIQSQNFGGSVSLSDQFILVGNDSEDTAQGSQVGIAYLFDTSGNLVHTFNNPEPELFDGFGSSVSIDGDLVVIAAKGDRSGHLGRGEVYLFDTSGNLLKTYNDSAGGAAQEFGKSVSISGNKILVGSLTTDGGKGYLFDTSGNLLQTYNNPDLGNFQRFGFSVSLSANKVLIGNPNNDLIGFDEGSAYLFDTSGNLLKTYDNPSPSNAARFGTSVSVSVDKVLIGSPFFEGIFAPPGNAYLFDTSGNLLQTYNSGSITTDFFGGSVSLLGENVLIGAFEGNTGVDRSGVAYLYDTSNNLIEIFDNPTPAFRDKFGFSVSQSLSGNVVIGAPRDNNASPGGGAVYLYEIANLPPVCESIDESMNISSFENGVIVTSSSSPTIKNIDLPPFHKTVEIVLSGITDVDGDAISLNIDTITQDEPTSGLGNGDKFPDGFGVGTDTASIRVERDGTGDGRVYEVSFTADDGNGGQCSSSRLLGVPHDNNKDPINSGQMYDSTIP